MDILQYLIELIQNRKEIGLKDLGTLYKKKSPGRYDAETHLFLPPSYVLDFTTTVKEDQNLAQFISKKRNISVDSANYFISEYVADIKKTLQADGEFTFERLGKLSQTDGEHQFAPVNDVNFGFDFYGLPPVNSEVTDNQQTPITETQPIEEATTEELPLVAQIEEENRLEEENPGDEFGASDHTAITAEENELEIEETPVELPETVEDKVADSDDWNFDDVAASPTPANQDPVVEEEPAPAAPIEETSDAAVAQPVHNEIATDEEVYEEINEVIVPVSASVSPTHEVRPEEVEVDFSKNWDFDEPVANANEKTIGVVPPSVPEIEEIEEADQGMPTYLKVVLAALALVVIIVVLYFVNPNLFSSFTKNEVNPDQKIAVPIAEQDNLKSQADSLAKADEIVKSAQNSGLEVEAARDTLKASVTAKPLSGITYEIISVAFETKTEAEKYITRMKARGIVAKTVPAMPGKRIKISVATFNNLDSASKQLPTLKKTLKNSELYIFTNKPKEK